MKKLLFIFLLGLSIQSFGQGNWQLTGAKNRWGNGIGFGNKDTSSYTNSSDTNLLVLQYPGSVLCYRHLLTDHWQIIATAPSGSSYVLVSDTAFMLLPYLRKSDTASMLSNRLKISDTALMLDRLDFRYSYLNPVNSRLAYIDQFYQNMYGRGLLTSQPTAIVSEQSIFRTYNVGANSIGVADTSKFIVGSTVVIKHANGIYYPYFISSKGGNDTVGTIGIKPALKYQVTSASKVERLWYDAAHPGKFYMRSLAQQIANLTETNGAVPTFSRTLFTNFSDTPAVSKDTLVAVGGGVINYYAADNYGADTASPPRFPIGKTAYVEVFAAGDGAETKLFFIDRPTQMTVSIYMETNNTKNAYSFQVVNDSGRVIAKQKLATADSMSKSVPYIYRFAFSTAYSNKLKIKIVADTVTNAAALSISQIDVMEQPIVNKNVISKTNGTIVVFGDSWWAGTADPERATAITELQAQLPYATIINSSKSGRTTRDFLAEFDTAVAVYNPDYVVLQFSTNNIYNPVSSEFYPGSVNADIDEMFQLIQKVLSIGARPILLGIPAGAQTDTARPTYPTWLLNDRARLIEQKFYKSLSKYTKLGGDYEGIFLAVTDTASMLANYARTGSAGSVTTVSVVTANGISGTVANPTTTPAITLSLSAITPTSILSSGPITGTTIGGTLTTAAQSNITSLGTLSALTVSGSSTLPTIYTSNITASGSAMFATGSFSGTITSSTGNSGNSFNANGATTGYNFGRFVNTGGNTQFGVDGSAGGFFTGSPSYASVFGSATNTSVVIATNGIVRQEITGAGAATFASTVTATGLITSGALQFSAASSQTAGSLARNSTYGMLLYGIGGSIADVTLTNASGTAFMYNPTGTTNVQFAGSITGGAISGTTGDFSSTIRMAAYTVGTLPTAGTAGRIAYVTDALTPAFLTVVVGGGAVKTPVFDNGTNWVAF